MLLLKNVTFYYKTINIYYGIEFLIFVILTLFFHTIHILNIIITLLK